MIPDKGVLHWPMHDKRLAVYHASIVQEPIRKTQKPELQSQSMKTKPEKDTRMNYLRSEQHTTKTP